MTVFSIAVVWLAVGFAVAVLFGAAVRKTRREPNDDAVSDRRGADIRYLRKQTRSAATSAPRRHIAKRHAAA